MSTFSYQFNAPQRVDFSEDNSDVENNEALANQDGYFKERKYGASKRENAPILSHQPSREEGEEHEETNTSVFMQQRRMQVLGGGEDYPSLPSFTDIGTEDAVDDAVVQQQVDDLGVQQDVANSNILDSVTAVVLADAEVSEGSLADDQLQWSQQQQRSNADEDNAGAQSAVNMEHVEDHNGEASGDADEDESGHATTSVASRTRGAAHRRHSAEPSQEASQKRSIADRRRHSTFAPATSSSSSVQVEEPSRMHDASNEAPSLVLEKHSAHEKEKRRMSVFGDDVSRQLPDIEEGAVVVQKPASVTRISLATAAEPMPKPVPRRSIVNLGNYEAARELRSIVEETNAFLARHNQQQEPATTRILKPIVATEPVFRGTWVPKLVSSGVNPPAATVNLVRREEEQPRIEEGIAPVNPTEPEQDEQEDEYASSPSRSTNLTRVLVDGNDQHQVQHPEEDDARSVTSVSSSRSSSLVRHIPRAIPSGILTETTSKASLVLSAKPQAQSQARPRTPPMVTRTTNSSVRPTFQRRNVVVAASPVPTTAASTAPVVHGYRVKSEEEVVGRSRMPGYLTPTQSSQSKYRPKTPTRATPVPPPSAVPASAAKRPTTPQTPHLATKARTRSNSGQLVSSTTRELEQIAQQRRDMLEAKEKERARLQRLATAGSRPVTPRAMTEPQPFHLRTDARLGGRDRQPSPSFHSQAEIASQILARDSKFAASTTMSSTRSSTPVMPTDVVEPHSPRLHTDQRMRGSVYKSSEEMEWERVQREKAELARERERRDQERTMMNSSVLSSASTTSRAPLTNPRPFDLESVERHERAQREFQARVERERREEEAKRRFQARPAAVLARPAMVPQHVFQATTSATAPMCVERAMVNEEMRRARLEREQIEAERRRQFRARSAPRTTYEPGFVPALSEAPLVDPVEPSLRTDERAEKRAMQERVRREQEESAEAERAEQERQARMRQEQEVREYRRTLVHRPLPVPDSSRFSVSAQHMEFLSQQQDFSGAVPMHDPADLHQPIPRRASLGSAGLGGGAHRIQQQIAQDSM